VIGPAVAFSTKFEGREERISRNLFRKSPQNPKIIARRYYGVVRVTLTLLSEEVGRLKIGLH
jgi:hypothetical protein